MRQRRRLQLAVVGRPLHPAVEIFRTIQISVPSAREHLRIATTAPRHYLVAVSRPLPLAARDPRRRLADAGDQYRTTCLGTHSSRRTIERGTTIRGRKPGLLRQELDEHLSRPSGRGGLIACHLGDYHPSQHPARTVLKSICRREAISVAHTVVSIPQGAIIARDHILPAMLHPVHLSTAPPRLSRLIIAAAGAIGVDSNSIHHRANIRPSSHRTATHRLHLRHISKAVRPTHLP